MAKYKHKPLVVEAILCKEALYGFSQEWKALPKWLADHYEKGGVVPTPKGVFLPLGKTSILVNPEDWIVRNEAGDVYFYRAEEFATRYELV
jgi:hypothetical protein